MNKKILWLIILTPMFTLLSSCSDDDGPNHEIHYIDMDCVIVEKLPVVPIGRSSSKGFLIRSIKDTTLYSEYISLNNYYMDDSIYYNHEVGDTLHFDYILKKRFFSK